MKCICNDDLLTARTDAMFHPSKNKLRGLPFFKITCILANHFWYLCRKQSRSRRCPFQVCLYVGLAETRNFLGLRVLVNSAKSLNKLRLQWFGKYKQINKYFDQPGNIIQIE